MKQACALALLTFSDSEEHSRYAGAQGATCSLQASAPSLSGGGESPSPTCSWPTSFPPHRASHPPSALLSAQQAWVLTWFSALKWPRSSGPFYSLSLPSRAALYMLLSGPVHRAPALKVLTLRPPKPMLISTTPPCPAPSVSPLQLLAASRDLALLRGLGFFLAPWVKAAFFSTPPGWRGLGVLLGPLLLSRGFSLPSLLPKDPQVLSPTGGQRSLRADGSSLKPANNLLLPASTADLWPQPLPCRSSSILAHRQSLEEAQHKNPSSWWFSPPTNGDLSGPPMISSSGPLSCSDLWLQPRLVTSSSSNPLSDHHPCFPPQSLALGPSQGSQPIDLITCPCSSPPPMSSLPTCPA